MRTRSSTLLLCALPALLLAAPASADTSTVPSGASRRFLRLTTDPATCRDGDVWKNITTGLFKGCTADNTIAVFTVGGVTQAAADLRYLKLAADNDPLTGQLALAATGLSFPGSTSGTTTLVATAIAGTTALTLPAATDTLVGRATTDTLTNKTLTSAVLTSPTISDTITSYGGSTTAGTGVAVVAAALALTAQSAAIGTTTLLASPPAGLYRITYYHEITRAATSSSSTQLTLNWTAAVAQTTAGAAVATNVLGDLARGTLVVRVASGSITYSTAYSSSGATTMQYGLNVTVERVQ